MKKLLLILLISSLFLSCYIEDTNSKSGTITFNLPVSKASAPGTITLKLKFFSSGDMKTTQTASEISYDSDYPEQISVSGPLEFTYSNTVSGGTATITGVPSETELELLVEHFEEYSTPNEDWYINEAGLSFPFTVGEGENTNVSLMLKQAANASLSADLSGSFGSEVYFLLLDEYVFNNYVEITGSGINFNRGITPTYIKMEEYFFGAPSPYPYQYTDMLPGRKMKILARSSEYISAGSDVAVSETFEILPGTTKTNISFTNYTFYC